MQHSDRPEYTYDYHWGRIIFAAALLVGLGTGAFLLFSGEDEPSNLPTVLTQSETSEPSPPIIAEETTTAAIEAEPDTKAKPAEKEIPEAAVIDNHTPTNSKAPAVMASTEIKVESTSDKSSDTRTKAELFTAAIKRAKLTAQVKRREPGESLPQDLELNPNGLSKVYFYTEVIGQAGKTHYHHWYKDGKLQAKVPITIGSDRWRCYSSKYLTHQQTGEWTVKVKDTKGKLLAQSDFNFINQ